MQTELNYDIVFDAQEHFRLLLDSMARPGKINTFPASEIFPPEGLNTGSALTFFALLNADVTYFICSENAAAITEYLVINTASQQAEISVADYIFLPEGYFGEELGDARTGTPVYPEDSATFIAQCDLISNTPHRGSVKIKLQGPGVNGEAEVFVSGVDARLLDFAIEQNSEYPIGLDLIITDHYNNLLCIPRSNKLEYSAPGSTNL